MRTSLKEICDIFLTKVFIYLEVLFDISSYKVFLSLIIGVAWNVKKPFLHENAYFLAYTYIYGVII